MRKSNKAIRAADISPVCLIKAVIRNLWMVIAAALIFSMGASLYIEYFHQPIYSASMTYVITSKKTTYYPGTSVTAAKEVGAVMEELFDSDIILRQLRASDEKLIDFDGTLTATVVEGSNFIVISSRASSPESAFLSLKMLNEILPSFSEFLSSNSVIQTIRNPSVSSYPINALNTRKICMTAAMLGGALMVVLVAWLAIRRETVQTREGAHHLLDASILATIRHEKKNRTLRSFLRQTTKGLQVFAPTTSFAYAEQINSICSQLEHEASAHGRKIFLITGVGENEGKSTVSGNIAAALAMRGSNVAILDADLRKPSLNLFFDGKYNAPLPLNRLLAEPFSNDNLFKCIRRHEKLGLYMLFPLKSDSRSTELITGDTMPQLLKKLRRMDFVIIDSPPMGICPDAEALADISDASILVVRQDYTAACDINDAADALRSANAAFLGCILNDMNDVNDFIPGGYGYKKKYGYGGYYGYGAKHSSGHGEKE